MVERYAHLAPDHLAKAANRSRLVYVLTQIAKVLELTEIERRLIRLEARSDGKLPAPD